MVKNSTQTRRQRSVTRAKGRTHIRAHAQRGRGNIREVRTDIFENQTVDIFE